MSKITVTRVGPQRSVRLAIITNCHHCPYISRPEHTPGSGCGQDYYCTAVTPCKLVVGYVEWTSDRAKDHDFPDWCPLEQRSMP